MLKLRLRDGGRKMKIKAWFSGIKKWMTKVFEVIVAGEARNNDDWWRHSGQFPGDW